MLFLTLAITWATSTLASRLAAQDRGLAQYWDALSVTRSITEAHAVPRPVNTTRNRDGDIAEGILKLREYELTYDRTTALVAIRGLQRVVERMPKDAWAHFALGAALARGPDVKQRPYAERTVYVVFSKGTLAALHAPRELKRALELDPSLELAAIELGQLAIDFTDGEMAKEALAFFAADGMKASAAGLLLQSKLQQRLGATAVAQKLAQQAEQAGSDPALAAYEQAESLFRSARVTAIEAGATAYFDGAAMLTPAGSDLYYSTIELILTAAEQTEWQSASLAARGRWLKQFWDMRAALTGVSTPQRLAEHFRRTAMLDPFRVAKTSATPTAQSLKSRFQPKLSEKTPHILSIMRHGQANRAEMYQYCAPGWDTLPIPMQPSLRSCMEAPYAASRFMSHGQCPPLSTKNWIHPDSLIGWLDCKSRGGRPDEMDVVAMRGNRYAAEKRSVRGETYYPAYTRPIAIAWEALQFHGPGSGAEIIAAVAIPDASAAALADASGGIDAVMHLTLADTTDNWIIRGRTRSSGAAIGSHALMHTSVAAQTANGVALRIRVESPDGSAGAIAYGSIDIAAFPEDSLSISDIVLSPNDGNGTFRRGDINLTLAPGRAFLRSEAPVAYYEVYGATPQSNLKTEIRVDALRGTINRMIDRMTATSHAISFSFEDAVAQPLPQFGVQLARTLDLQALEPGDYRITVTVTDLKTGRSATRGRLLTVEM